MRIDLNAPPKYSAGARDFLAKRFAEIRRPRNPVLSFMATLRSVVTNFFAGRPQ